MAGRVIVKIEGGEELLAKLAAMGVNVGKVLEAAVTAGSELIAEGARSKAPGPYIEAVIDPSTSSGGTSVTMAIGPDKAHWFYRFFETGAGRHEIKGSPFLAFEGREGLVLTGAVMHPGMKARPFLRPSFDQNQNRATDLVGEHLRRAVE